MCRVLTASLSGAEALGPPKNTGKYSLNMQVLLHLSNRAETSLAVSFTVSCCRGLPWLLLHTDALGRSLLLLYVGVKAVLHQELSVCLSVLQMAKSGLCSGQGMSTAGRGGREMVSQLSICSSSNGTEVLKVVRIFLLIALYCLSTDVPLLGFPVAGLPQDCKEGAEKSFVCAGKPNTPEKQSQGLPEGAEGLNPRQTG